MKLSTTSIAKAKQRLAELNVEKNKDFENSDVESELMTNNPKTKPVPIGLSRLLQWFTKKKQKETKRNNKSVLESVKIPDLPLKRPNFPIK